MGGGAPRGAGLQGAARSSREGVCGVFLCDPSLGIAHGAACHPVFVAVASYVRRKQPRFIVHGVQTAGF